MWITSLYPVFLTWPCTLFFCDAAELHTSQQPGQRTTKLDVNPSEDLIWQKHGKFMFTYYTIVLLSSILSKI